MNKKEILAIEGLVILAIALGTGSYLASQQQQAKKQPVLQGTIAQDKNAKKKIEEPVYKTAQAFFGIVQKKDKDAVVIQEYREDKKPSSKTFTVAVNPQTVVKYQRPPEEPNKPFNAEDGKIENIKEGMYVFVMTDDDPNTAQSINATQLFYSDKQPF